MKRILSLAVFCLLVTGVMFGQVEAGQVSGLVTDSTGAVISGATITVHNVDTGFERQVVSSSAGLYEVVELPVGNYTVKVCAGDHCG